MILLGVKHVLELDEKLIGLSKGDSVLKVSVSEEKPGPSKVPRIESEVASGSAKARDTRLTSKDLMNEFKQSFERQNKPLSQKQDERPTSLILTTLKCCVRFCLEVKAGFI